MSSSNSCFLVKHWQAYQWLQLIYYFSHPLHPLGWIFRLFPTCQSFRQQFSDIILPDSSHPSVTVLQEGHLEAGLHYMYIFHFLYVATSRNNLYSCMDFPGVSDGKESVHNAWDLDLIPGLGRSLGEGKGSPLQYSGLENSMDYSPWGCKELDMTFSFTFIHSISVRMSTVGWYCSRYCIPELTMSVT